MLSIIIVNYKSEELILNCLRSIYAQPGQKDFEIIIVSNASAEQGKHMILDQFPHVMWEEMGYNAGFARANNKGIGRSSGDTLLLLNPDVVVEENAIAISYHKLLASDYIGCGVQLLNEDRSPQISGNYFMKGGLNHLLPLPVLGKVFKWTGNLLKVKKPNVPDAKGTVEVDWINGAYLMVKKSAVEKAGLLDEDFFLYAEEIEWCSRLRQAGKLCIYGDLHVVHLQGEVSHESFGSGSKGYYNLFNKRGKQLMVSNFLRIRKQFGTGWLMVHMFFYLVEVPFFFIKALFAPLLKPANRLSFQNFTGYCKNLFSVIRLIPPMVRNKPHFYKVI